MTNTPEQPSRLDRIEVILEQVAIKQNRAQDQIITLEEAIVNLANRQANTQNQLDELLTTATNIFNRDAVLNDVLLELQQSHEHHQIRFEENQRATNAALERLEAILLQLIRRFPEE